MDQEWIISFFLLQVCSCRWFCCCCCCCSAEPVGGAAEWHEGRRDPATGHAVQSPAHRRPPANVREEHPQPTGQQGHRDAHSPGQQTCTHTHLNTHTHTHTRRLTGWSLPELPALMGNKIDGGRPMKIQSPLSCPPTCGFSLLQICWVSRFFFVSLHNLKVVCIVSLIVASSVSINHFLHAHNSWQRSSLPLCSPYLRDPTRPHRTTEPPSPPPHRAPYTWGGPTTVRCRPDPSYQVSVWSSIIAQTQFFGLHYRCVNVSFFCSASVLCVWVCVNVLQSAITNIKGVRPL